MDAPTLAWRAALGGLLVGLLAGCGAQAEVSPSPAPAPVRVASPQLDPTPPAVTAIGRLEGLDEARLGFVTAGVIQTVRVDIGDRVKAGQVLATQDTTALDAGVRQAQEELVRARRDLARVQGLIDRQLVPRQQLDDAQTRVEVAEAARHAAGFQQRYGTILAERDGRVLQRLADPGEVVSAGQPVLVVSSAEQGWRLPVELADRDAVQLSEGGEATVTFDAFPGERFPAQVREVGGQAAAASGAITVDLVLKPTAAPLRSGLIGRARLTLPPRPTLVIPVTAVLDANKRSGKVLVVEDGRAQTRQVVLGALRGDRVEVLSGLSATDEVIAEGGAWADAGLPVAVQPVP